MNIPQNSNRLSYIKLGPEHFKSFCEMDLDAEVMKYYTSRPHGTIEAARASFERYLNYQNLYPHLGAFAALDKLTNEFIGLGVIIHLELNPENDRFEVGYRLPLKNWNQGYATEICQSLLSYGFQQLQLKEIYGTTHPENKASQKVLLKCGMKEIGTTPHYGGCTVFLRRPTA